MYSDVPSGRLTIATESTGLKTENHQTKSAIVHSKLSNCQRACIPTHPVVILQVCR